MDDNNYLSLDEEDETPDEVPLEEGLSLEDDDDNSNDDGGPQEVAEEKDVPDAPKPAVLDQPRDGELVGGMTIKEVYTAYGGSDDSEHPTTDVVHVTAICPQIKMRTLDQLLGDPPERTWTTELVFRVEMAGLLAGDLTEDLAEQQAKKLLEGLSLTQSAVQRRAIIFVAYDFGSLVLKLALTLAARFPEKYPWIATNTSRIFLQGESDREWSQLVTLSSVHHLAGSVLRATERFIDSKMTLRSRIASIYANKSSPGDIHAVWDRFTATLGVPSEGLVEEQTEGEKRFPLLTYYTAYKVENLLQQPEFLDLEPAFVSLAAPHRQSQFDPLRIPWLEPELKLNRNYTQWLKRNETRPLYVYGSSRRATHDVSDYISLVWRKEMAEKSADSSKALVFNFDSADPLRDSMADMVASFILEVMNVYPGECLTGRTSGLILEDWYRAESGWSEESCIVIIEALRIFCFNDKALFVLNDLDQCSRESRVAFLDYLSDLSDRCGRTFNVVITTQNPQALHGEIHDCLELSADSYALAFDSDNVLEETQVKLLDRLGGSSTHENRLKEVFKKFTPFDKGIVTKLQLAKNHSEWPANSSFESFDRFTVFVQSIRPDETPEETLDKTLRSVPDYEEFRWVLGWVISGYRPLSLDELSDLLRFHRAEGNWPASTSSKRSLTAGYSQQLKSWLRVLATFEDNRVRLRDEIRDIVGRNLEAESFTWTEVARMAHQAIVEFCLAYLVSAEARSQLEDLFSGFGTRIGDGAEEGCQPSTVSIAADGEGILFYIVQAFPFHLSKCSPDERAGALERLLAAPENNPYTPWARVYWAMSNPFLRTSNPPESPLPILVGLDILSYEDVKDTPLDVRQQCIVAAAGSRNNTSMVTEYLQDTSSSAEIPFFMNVLLAAVRGYNEQAALEVVARISSLSEGDGTAIKWPESAIWAASWLNMDRFATAILSRGANPDPLGNSPTPPELTTGYYPGPLYLSCCLGHEALVKALADHGADLHQLRDNRIGCLQSAADRGFAGVAKLLVARDHSLLESRLPSSSLYDAADFGSHKVVEALLELGADPEPGQSGNGGPEDPGSGWNPLSVACFSSYPRVVEILLRRKADPNCIGASCASTPILFATTDNADLECVRLLLEHGADPNHELLSPPLILELESSPNDEGVVVEVCELLRRVGEKPMDIQAADGLGATALMRSARRGRMALLRWLLDNGADINAQDSDEESALHYAATAGQVEATRELLQRGARVDIGGSPVLLSAIHHPEVFKLLLDAGADPDAENSSGNSAININIGVGQEDVVKMLIEKKANIDHPDPFGWPRIFGAVFSADTSLTRLLADGGADLTRIVDGASLLHYAVSASSGVMGVLLEFTRYLKLETVDRNGDTALLRGSLGDTGNFECLKRLILAGADVNAKDKDNETALHNAVRNGNYELVSLLLAQPETDINCVGSYGTALQQACRRRMTPTIRTLLDKGALINQVTPKCINSTSLVAALYPTVAYRDQDSEDIDRLVRELVERGADVKQAVRGSLYYTALSAACLGAGANTINFLLDEGAVADVADPVFGRLPLHFAAANGLENFRTILLAFRGSLLHPDAAGKTSLHWAAQFGNADAVRFILASKAMGEGAARARYMDQRDEHGWTPLCWAVRQLDLGWVEGMRSETADHAAVVRVLLENGADAGVDCRLGNGETTETLTVLELARRSAGDEVIGALTNHLEQRGAVGVGTSDGPFRRYQVISAGCDMCLSSIIGYNYRCTSCPGYVVCTTCLPTISKYHNSEVCEDDLPHAFERNDGAEYQELPYVPYDDDAGDADAAPHSTRTSSSDGLELSDNPDNEGGAEEVVLDDPEGGS
ncbi:ankyrin repeat-containing domain protein [Chaetomium tenue]|uniref:Ankyrin repeat-containing domain protein n=1 Tax=Chaetomium tenue TaxID=1854479 RepID=A0ACB7P2P9_9PEZI|nr:ankyrin repeat-containing domain protein [Chaetomium globosum]